MTVSLPRYELARTAPDDIDLLVVGVRSDGDREDDRPLEWDFLRRRGFTGATGQVQSLPGEAGVHVLAVGLGPSKRLGPDTFRRAGATIGRHARRSRSVATTVLDGVDDLGDRALAGQALVEGLALGAYRFTEYKTSVTEDALELVTVVGTGGKRVQAGLDRGAAIARAVITARDLVNEPGGSLTPKKLASVARSLARRHGFELHVLDERGIRREKLGGLLAVNRGSVEPARFLQLSYEPSKRARGTVALVGKGITFDSGGLSLKRGDSMATMKDDMGGAAAVLATFAAIAETEPPVRVLGFVPCTDNMPSGDATRPGDVIEIRGGTTVEVLNTDAEGRLVLADALVLAAEQEPDAVVDLATLTGTCEVALGKKIAGLMGNHRDWLAQIKEAGRRSGERLWEMPLPADYRRQLNSDVADLKNVGTRYGGTLVAGLFLQEFVERDLPWAHLDIAGPAWSAESEGIVQRGGTGYGVRLLVELLHHFHQPSS